MKFMQSTALALVLGLAGASAASAQTVDADVMALNDWRYDDLYSGAMSAEEFIDEMDVFGPTGEEIGDVEDIIAGQDGKLLAVIAEVGGFWDIGDTHVSIPWSEIELVGGGVSVPVTEENVDQYGLFDRDYLTADAAANRIVGEVDAADTGPRSFRLSELIGDYARLRGEGDQPVNYGYVQDVMIRDGEIAAVIVAPDVGYGVGGFYGYPWHGHGYIPGGRYYDMPYAERDIADMEAFEYDRVEALDET